MLSREPHSVFRSIWWKPKPGPLVTDGRLAHVYLAAALALGPALFGPRILARSMVFVFPGFLGWELLFPLLRRIHKPWGGKHPFGDVVDFLAFLLGWLVGIFVVTWAWS